MTKLHLNIAKKRGMLHRSIMNKGQGQSGQLEGISLTIIMFIYEVNPQTNNKVIQK